MTRDPASNRHAAPSSVLDLRPWLNPRRARFWVAAVLLVYTLVGFLLVPWVAKREIVAIIGSQLDRSAQVEQVRFNPYALSAEVRGLRISEAGGTPLLGFDRLYVNFQLSSLFRWAWTFREIRLEGLSANLIRFADGDTNVGRMLAAVKSAPAPEQETTTTGMVRAIVQKLTLVDIRAKLRDETRPTPFTTQIGPAKVSVQNLSTLPEKEGTHQIIIDTEGGGRIAWRGQLGLNPLASQGHIAVSGALVSVLSRYLDGSVTFTAADKRTALDLDYQVATQPDGNLSAVVDHLEFAMVGLTLQSNGENQPFLQLPELHVAGGHFAWPGKTAGASALTLSGLDLRLLRSATGQLNLAQLLVASKDLKAIPAQAPAPAGEAAAEAGDPLAGWDIRLGKLGLMDAKLRFDDKALSSPADVEVSDLALTVKDISNQAGARFPLALDLRLTSGGQLKVDGGVSLLPGLKLDGTVTGRDLAVAVAQPYLSEFARVRVADGKLGFESHVSMPSVDQLTVDGNLDVSSLDIRDTYKKQRLLGWKRVAVDRYEYSLADKALNISQIDVDAPYARIRINADRSTNVQDLLIKRASPPSPSKLPAPEAASLKLIIGKVTIANGAADFTDRSLPLPFETQIAKLEGQLSTLSTSSRKPAALKLRGQVDQYGVAQIDGLVTPLDIADNTDIHVLFRNIRFPDLSPYTVKFAGQRIDDGRLEVNLQYRLQSGKLEGENSVVISDLQLGDKVDQPGAMNLPLALAVALLKDAEGKIKVDLPVRGDINDPQFEIGGVIRKAVVQVLTGIVTSPFRALASLVGIDASSFDRIAFEPGSAEVPPPAQEQLAKLVEALIKRPGLALEVPGAVVPDADRAALQAMQLQAQIDAGMKALNKGSPGDSDWTAQQQRVVEALFRKQFSDRSLDEQQAPFRRPPPDDPQGKPQLDKNAYVSALREQLQKTVVVDDDELDRLAAARAAAVVSAMTADGRIPAERIHTTEGGSAKTDDRGWVDLKLALVPAGKK